jgi:NhaP-type Na+/H+ or K+/H+ antiporter
MSFSWTATLRLLAVLAIVAMVSQFSPSILGLFEHSSEAELLMTFFSIALIFALSFSIFYLSQDTPLPNFVIAIFFGMAAHPLLVPVIHSHGVLGALVGFGATLILFGGGLETPFANFKKLFGKIIMLSFVGLLLTAILFSWSLGPLGEITGISVSMTTAILLGALLASTDPAAIIPVLRRLRFHNPATKDLVVSESAMTDVTGTLLTVTFLSLLSAGALGTSLLEGYGAIFTPDSGLLLLRQVVFGLGFGLLGYGLLHILTRFKETHDREYEADSAFFLFIPIIIFTLALAFGGSGYLAAFIAGLLFKMTEQLHETERFFNHTIDGFFKPTIFLMLGALVDIPALIEYAPLGLLAALVFMFAIRPLAVWVSLAPFTLRGKNRPTFQEIFFVSFVRETGAIPAVLLVTIASLNLAGVEGLLPIGMWVILATLIIEPPLTPWVAQKLGVASLMKESKAHVAPHNDSTVVLGSRGTSWKNRLPQVVDWASKHNIPNVTLLLCLEYKYTPERAAELEAEAYAMIERLNRRLAGQDRRPINFHTAVNEGLLQEKIRHISLTHKNVVAIFVGRKMLDFKLDEIKKLSIPLYFMR